MEGSCVNAKAMTKATNCHYYPNKHVDTSEVTR